MCWSFGAVAGWKWLHCRSKPLLLTCAAQRCLPDSRPHCFDQLPGASLRQWTLLMLAAIACIALGTLPPQGAHQRKVLSCVQLPFEPQVSAGPPFQIRRGVRVPAQRHKPFTPHAACPTYGTAPLPARACQPGGPQDARHKLVPDIHRRAVTTPPAASPLFPRPAVGANRPPHGAWRPAPRAAAAARCSGRLARPGPAPPGAGGAAQAVRGGGGGAGGRRGRGGGGRGGGRRG